MNSEKFNRIRTIIELRALENENRKRNENNNFIIKEKKYVNTNNGKYLDIEFRENYLNIEVKLHTNMNNLNNVYVIESLNREEFKNISK